jgi:hypothetical protein
MANGRLVGLHGATVILTNDDEVWSLPLVSLTVEHREYVRAQLAAQGYGEAFPDVAGSKDAAATMRMSPADWSKQLKQWVDGASDNSPDKATAAQAARNSLRAIQDPQAVRALTKCANVGTDDSVRAACVEGLTSIGTAEAIQVLVKISVSDRSGFVRQAATWGTSQVKDQATVLHEYGNYLRLAKFREAALLGLFVVSSTRKESTAVEQNRELIESLIDILVITQSVRVGVQTWYYYDTGWVREITGGLHRHAESGMCCWVVPHKISVPCELARQLLARITQQDFGFEQRAWRQWNNSDQMADNAPVRADQAAKK